MTEKLFSEIGYRVISAEKRINFPIDTTYSEIKIKNAQYGVSTYNYVLI